MALLFLDGCGEYYNTSKIAEIWSPTGSTPVVLPTGGRRGGAGIELTTVDDVSAVIPDTTTLVIGGAFKFDTFSERDFMMCREGTTEHVKLFLTTAGAIDIKNVSTVLASTSNGVISLDTFHFIEFKVTIGNAGTIELKIDGAIVVTSQAADTQNGGTSIVDNIQFEPTLGTMIIDDIYILNTADGAPQDDFLGDIQIDAVFPDGAGNVSNFTPSAGSNWQNVDDNPHTTDTDFNETSTLNDIDLYTFGNLPSIAGGSTVISVKAMALTRRTDGSAINAQVAARPVSTNFFSGSDALATGYVYQIKFWDDNPETSIQWTDTLFNAAEFGLEAL